MPDFADDTPHSGPIPKGQIPLNLVRTLSSTSRRDAVNEADIEKQVDLEKADNGGDISGRTSSHNSNDRIEDQSAHIASDVTVVSFSRDDPLNPYCWPKSRKVYVTVAGILLVMNSTIGSSIAAGASKPTAEHFNITNQTQLVLPTSIYLVGYVLGPLFFSPLSETYGRKIIMISTFAIYTAFSLGCALAPSWAGLIVMRLLAGVGACTPISIIGGVYSDIWATPKARGRAMALFMGATTWGPLIGPVASGFIAVVSWRWTYWLQLIIAGATWPVLLTMPETYAPIVLKSKAKKLRKEGKKGAYAPTELEKRDLRELLVVVLTRPVRMFLFEGIVLCSCLYTAMVYGIFYSTSNVSWDLETRSDILTELFSVPPSIPHHLHRRLRLQRRRARPRLPPYRRRQRHLLHHLSNVGCLSRTRQQARSATILVRQRRIPSSPTRLSRSSAPQCEHVLARLDGQRIHTLDSPRHRNRALRRGLSSNFHGSTKLPRRRL
jgi:multidrug resistance protein